MYRSLPEIQTKLCGIRSLEQAESAVASGAGAIGLNCFATSKRFCELQLASRIADAVRDRLTVVALAVNPSLKQLAAITVAIRPDVLQLHGDESMEMMAQLTNSCRLPPILRAVRWPLREERRDAAWLEGWLHPPPSITVNGFLLDAAVDAVWGGSGVRIESATLGDVDHRLNGAAWMLAGGLDPDNVQSAIESTTCLAVDVASGIEDNGVPNAERMLRFVRSAQGAFAKRSERRDSA